MNPGRYFIPGMNFNPTMGSGSFIPRNLGLFGRITNTVRKVNWSGLLTNANKTINVVNQTIPLVKQARPMFNNMKSVFKLTKAFGKETTNIKSSQTSSNNYDNQKNDNNSSNIASVPESSNNPNFFI